MQIVRDVSLSEYSSLKVGGSAVARFVIEREEDVRTVFEQIEREGLSPHVVGSGTNTFFSDGPHEKLALVTCAMKDIVDARSPIEGTLVTADAGVLWDDLVRHVAEKKLWGLEALAGIPGTVGAAPVQNIGAYGAEAADTLEAVIVYDLKRKEIRAIPGRQCDFGYRTSIFNTTERGRYVILRARFWLMAKRRRTLHLEIGNAATPTEAGEKIRALRTGKLPNPAETPNCGCYFKNPIVSVEDADALTAKFANMPKFLARDGVKLSAGWLIENAGLKGKSFGHAQISPLHALVLTTDGKASATDVLVAEAAIVAAVKAKFSVTLAREPEYVE